jgi:hypothetical protein
MQRMQKGLVTKRSRNNAGRSREDGNASNLLVDANTTGNFNVNGKQFGAYESYAERDIQMLTNKTLKPDEKQNALQFPEISQGN